MVNVFSPTSLPGFRVRPQDDVPGFDIDEYGMPRRERTSSDTMRPGSVAPRYPDLAQAMMPTPGSEASVQPLPLPPPDWLYNLLTMPLPALPSSGRLAPLSGSSLVPYGTPFNTVGPYSTTDQNVREMGDARGGPGTEQWPSSDAPPPPLAGIDALHGAAIAQNGILQPADEEVMRNAWPQPPDDNQPYAQAAAAGPQDLSGAEIAQQAPGAIPAPSVWSDADPNFVLANTDGDDVQEAQQTQQPSRNTPPPVPQRPPAQAKPPVGQRQPSPLRREKSGEELTQLTESRREGALNEVRYKARREERSSDWDYMLRQLPVPAPPGSKIQEPLPFDWRAAVRRINPSYLDYTEAAAKKYGIPPELLARLLYRESSFDKNKRAGKDGPVGLPQMYPPALKDLGIDPTTFDSASAAAQIDAGAAYLARQYRTFGDWPRAVAAYHFGASGLEAWLGGKSPTYENIEQRKKEESADFRWKDARGRKKDIKDPEEREKNAKVRADEQLGQWRAVQAYLPYVFLGDPSRYDRPKGP